MSNHTATYTFNKTTGQCLVRLQGPNATGAEGHEVPVTSKGGRTRMEKLSRLVWSGVDDLDLPGRPASGEPPPAMLASRSRAPTREEIERMFAKPILREGPPSTYRHFNPDPHGTPK